MANETDTTQHGPKAIWDTLRKIDISQFVEPKGTMKLDYLSWGAAWDYVMSIYPQAEMWYSHEESGSVFYHPDGSASVRCYVKINETLRSAQLGVMDGRSRAIIKPDSKMISDSLQRALVKALVFHGLGLSLYLKDFDDVPIETKAPPTKVPTKTKVRKKSPAQAPAMTLKVFAEGSETLKDLVKLYNSNEEVIKKMEKDDPTAHAAMMEAFTKRKTELTDELEYEQAPATE